jgi:tetratricopeptide (TPR) repeat protein/TolB-like protein
VRRLTALGAAAVVVIGAAVGGWMWLSRPAPAPPVGPPAVSVLVADFRNTADEPLFDGLIEQALGVGLEGASFITLYPRRDALRLVAQIKAGAKLDSEHAVLVAVREGVGRVLTGAIARQGNGYALTANVVDPRDARVLFSMDAESPSKEKVLDAVGQLAAKVRRQLGDPAAVTGSVRESETFTAASLEAAAVYAQAQELQWAGKFEEAVESYQRAVALDPTLGRAYAGLGAVSNSLGRRREAEEYYKQALQRLDRMTDREKYRTRGGYYLLIRNNEKAREEMEALLAQFPADTAGLANLAVAEFNRRDMAKAVELGKQALVAMPRNVIRANNLALFEMYAGDFAAAEKQARAVLELNREFPKAHVALALAQLAAGRAEEAEQTYRTLDALPGAAKYYAAAGLADLLTYGGRLADAAIVLERAAKAEEAGSASRHARLLVMLAEVRGLQGRRNDALALAARAAARSEDEGVLFLAGRLLAASGRAADAKAAAAKLGDRLEQEPRIYARLIEAEIELARGSARDAIPMLQAAQQIADSWLGRLGLARAFLAAGALPEADSELDRCIQRRGEATCVLLDDVPSYHEFAPVVYYHGRVLEALKSPGGAEAYKEFLAIKANGDEQGLVADARRRLEGR